MTNQQPPESQNNPPESSLTNRIFNVVKQPKTQIVAGVTLVAIALVEKLFHLLNLFALTNLFIGIIFDTERINFHLFFPKRID